MHQNTARTIARVIAAALAGLGHGDYFLLCDAGFPIPEHVERIDLALSFNVPTMKQCLKAILDEIVVQKVTIAEEVAGLNAEGDAYICSIFFCISIIYFFNICPYYCG